MWEDVFSITKLEDSKLVELDVYSNAISVKNSYSITSLKIVNISRCKLSNLKDLVYNFPLLEELKATQNFDFCNMSDVEELVNLRKMTLTRCKHRGIWITAQNKESWFRSICSYARP